LTFKVKRLIFSAAFSKLAGMKLRLILLVFLILDHFNRTLENEVCYLMDPRGDTIASSNRLLERQIRKRTQEITSILKQLRRLSGSIMDRQEAERKAIARELHDELGQLLMALRMDSAWLCSRLKDTDAPASERALTMGNLIDKIIDGVRDRAIRLRPGVLDTLCKK